MYVMRTIFLEYVLKLRKTIELSEHFSINTCDRVFNYFAFREKKKQQIINDCHLGNEWFGNSSNIFSIFFFFWNNQIVLISFGLELIAIIFQHGWKIGGWCQTKTTYHIQSECTHLLLELVLVKVKHSAKLVSVSYS